MLAQLPLGSQLREEKCHQQVEPVLGKRAQLDDDAPAQARRGSARQPAALFARAISAASQNFSVRLLSCFA
eukprot:3987751-Pleurochrysis_carterae.AAC.1